MVRRRRRVDQTHRQPVHFLGHKSLPTFVFRDGKKEYQ